MWLNRQTRHLSDRQLLDCYLDSELAPVGDSSPALPPHVATCHACAQRYADLARDWTLAAAAGADEADAVFTAERLDEQLQRIMRRIAQHGHRADIFLFPTRGLPPSPPRVAAVWRPARWAAAGVGLAAGLVLGLAFDQVDFGDLLRPAASLAGGTAAATAADTDRFDGSLAVSGLGAPVSDDELLDSIDSALSTRRVPELLVYDEMTPERVAFSPRLR